MMNTLTHSMMQCFQDCRQKYQYRYVDEIVPVTSSDALYFGSAVHLGLESWFKYGIKDAALLAIECQNMPEPEIIRAKALLGKYIERWTPEQFEAVEVEYEFNAPIRNPETNRSSHVWRLRGKVDGLVRYKGELFILEHKTTSKCDGAYIDRILIDSQIATYANAITSFYREPVAGAITTSWSNRRPDLRKEKQMKNSKPAKPRLSPNQRPAHQKLKSRNARLRNNSANASSLTSRLTTFAVRSCGLKPATFEIIRLSCGISPRRCISRQSLKTRATAPNSADVPTSICAAPKATSPAAKASTSTDAHTKN